MKYKCFILIVLLTLVNCKNERNENTKNSHLNIVSNKELLKGWKIFLNDSVKLNIPNDWNPKSKKNLLFYSPTDKNNSSLYYVILKTPTSRVKIKDYIKEVFRQMSEKDSHFSYLLTKITFEDKSNCYKLDLYIKDKGVKFKIYCLLFERDNQIYDFSYKCLNNEDTNIENYRVFYNVLFSFQYKGSLIVDSEKFLVKNEEVIKVESL